jgi:hypothetical protein
MRNRRRRRRREDVGEDGTLPLILSQRTVKSMTPITCRANLRHWPKICKRGEGGTIMRLPVMLRRSSTLQPRFRMQAIATENAVRAVLTLHPLRREKVSRAQLCSLIAKCAMRVGAMRDESWEHTADIPGSK